MSDNQVPFNFRIGYDSAVDIDGGTEINIELKESALMQIGVQQIRQF